MASPTPSLIGALGMPPSSFYESVCKDAAENSLFPSQDIGCAAIFNSPDNISADTRNKMKSCCKESNVDSFANGCGLFCLAIGQSSGDLGRCIFKEDVAYMQMCVGDWKATATRTSNRPEETGGPSPSSPSSSPPSPSPSNAAGKIGVFEERKVSKLGMGIIVMMVSAAFATLL